MKLLTKEITTKLPALYTQEDEKDPMVICKFFAVWTSWTWYPIWNDVRTYLASIKPVEMSALIITFSKFKKEEKK